MSAPVLREPGHDVQVLHRLSRGALHKVVDGRDEDEALRLLVHRSVDATAVRADDLLELGRRVGSRRRTARRRRPRHRGREGRRPTAAAPCARRSFRRYRASTGMRCGTKVTVGAGMGGRGGGGGASRRSARRRRRRGGQARDDLRVVPVSAQGVGDEIAVDVAEVRALAGLPPAPLTPDLASITTSSSPAERAAPARAAPPWGSSRGYPRAAPWRSGRDAAR